MRTRNFIVSVFILFGCTQLFGQELRKEVCVGFRVGNGTLDTAYVDNTGRLAEIVSFLKDIQNDRTLELVEVEFCGSASPEGSILINRRLAKERLASLENYVRRYVALPDSIVTRREEVIAWEALARLVEKSDMPHKEEAVDVLRNVPETTYDSRGVLIDSRKKHLMELQYGRTWHYMEDHFFPQVRNASVVFVTVRQKPEVPAKPEPENVPQEVSAPAGTSSTVQEPVAVAPQPENVPQEVSAPAGTSSTVQEPVAVAPQPEAKKPFYMALKTNMLYDVLAVPNIGAEFYLGRNWSVSGNWMYGWWNSNSKHRYWRVYGGEIAVRKWLGRKAAEKPLTGHHLGVYGQLFTYDFEWNGTGYMGGQPGKSLWNSPNYAAGVEYGYALPIGRRLNIDFTIGLGYWGGKYYTYNPLDDHYVWESTKNRHWFGPTKAEISLVWLIGWGNTNNRKGGVR